MKLLLLTTTFFLFSFNLLLSQVDGQNSKNTILKGKASLLKIPSQKQSKEKRVAELEPTFFLLGTLNDYMGRSFIIKENNQIDQYYPNEDIIITFLTKYIEKELNIQIDTINNFNRSRIFSESLFDTLNNFYDLKDNILEEKFTTHQQINSFLTGVYYRYGDKLDSSIYKIQLSNSPKHQNCYNFLKKVGCHKIFYKYLQNIPAQFILYFEPSANLKEYLDLIESQRILRKESSIEYMNSVIDNYYKISDKINEKELAAIRKAFE